MLCVAAVAGKLTSVGAGAGSGYTINIPLPGDAGHDSMAAVWQQVVMPAARRFQPDLILCSAGNGRRRSAAVQMRQATNTHTQYIFALPCPLLPC